MFVPHQFEYRVDRAPRRHHGRGRDFVDLNDGGLAARAKRKDRRGDGFGIIALVARHDLVIGLRCVEIGGEFFQLPAELARHRMPPHDVGGRLAGDATPTICDDCCELQKSQNRFHHKIILLFECAETRFGGACALIRPCGRGCNPPRCGRGAPLTIIAVLSGWPAHAGSRQKNIEPFSPSTDIIIRG